MTPDQPDPAETGTQISTDDARQGERRGMIYILGGGLAIAVLLIGVVLAMNAV